LSHVIIFGRIHQYVLYCDMKKNGLCILFIIGLLHITSCGNETNTDNKMHTDEELLYASEAQLNVLNAAIEANPDDPDLYYKRGDYFFRINNFSTAENDIQKAIRFNDTKYEYWLLSAQIQNELNNGDKALNEGLKALQLGCTEPSLYVLLASCYLDKNDKTSSDVYLQRLISIAPQMAEVSYIQAKQLLANGYTTASMNKFKECIRKDHQNIDAYIDLMALFYKKHQYDSVMPLLIKAKRMRPSQSELFLYEGKFFESINRDQVACAAYKEGLICNPQAIELFLPLSMSLEKQKQYNEAMNYLGKWLEKNPADKNSLLKMAELSAHQNDKQGAITYYKDYLALDSTNLIVQRAIKKLQKELDTPQQEPVYMQPTNNQSVSDSIR